MPLLRLLSTSLLASAFILQASAQSPATTLVQTPTPLAITVNPTPAIASFTVPEGLAGSALLTVTPKPFHFNLSKNNSALLLNADKHPLDSNAKALTLLNPEKTVLMAQTHSPCYTLRSYNFTAKDLKSPNPRPSSATDCTPASSVQLKAIEIQGIKK
jgi:hypothetical protein